VLEYEIFEDNDVADHDPLVLGSIVTVVLAGVVVMLAVPVAPAVVDPVDELFCNGMV
jgi:hypothetical protein